ncbi:MAG TPA: hypothetical protein VGE24_11190 [Emticicia sp.]
MKAIMLMLVLSIASCATKPFYFDSNRDFWIGKSGDDLAIHPIFASMPMDTRKTETGIETRSFKNKSGIQSEGLNNNQGKYVGWTSEVACNHVFLLKNNVITNYQRVGNCTSERLEFRPLDHDGNPVLSQAEVEYLNKKKGQNCGILNRMMASTCE